LLAPLIREQNKRIKTLESLLPAKIITYHASEFPFFESGISAVEASHRWSEGQVLTINIPLRDPMTHSPSKVVFRDVTALVTKCHSQKVTMTGCQILDQIYDFDINSATQTISVLFPLKDVVTYPSTNIRFTLLNARSPKSLGI